MIKVRKGNKIADFTGKDYKWLIKTAKSYGLTPQHLFTGMMWEMVMREARTGTFKKGGKYDI